MANKNPLAHVTALTLRDPDHHDVFPGGKRAVEVKAVPTIAQIWSVCFSLQRHQEDFTAVAVETSVARPLVSQIARDYRAAWFTQS